MTRTVARAENEFFTKQAEDLAAAKAEVEALKAAAAKQAVRAQKARKALAENRAPTGEPQEYDSSKRCISSIGYQELANMMLCIPPYISKNTLVLGRRWVG